MLLLELHPFRKKERVMQNSLHRHVTPLFIDVGRNHGNVHAVTGYRPIAG